MTWAASAQTLLDAATAVTLTTPVARSFVAAGGSFARDCRLLAVYPTAVDAAPLSRGEVPGGSCAVIPVLGLTLSFVADCYPTANDQGKPPRPDAVTAWTASYLADVEAIWQAIADAKYDGSLGDCDSVSLDRVTFSGPGGGIAEADFPVRLLST